VQDSWSTLEQKYKDLVFKLIDFINENVVPEENNKSLDTEVQTDPTIKEYSELDFQLKGQYEAMVTETTTVKKQLVLRNQEIQRIKLALYSKNLEYKKQVQNNARINTDRNTLTEKLKEYKSKWVTREEKIDALKVSLQRCKGEYK